MKWLLLALACAAHPALAAERTYSVTDFDEIRVIGGHRVTVAPGRATNVKATAPSTALETLSIETQGRTLVIQSLTQTLAASPSKPVGAASVSIILPLLKAVRLQGSGSINAVLLRGFQADVALSGSGAIVIGRIEADRANLKLAGAGRVETAGKVKELTADVKGSGEMVADKLVSADLKVTAATSGRAAFNASRTANVTATGSGEVLVGGSAACTVKNSGVGTVTCGKN